MIPYLHALQAVFIFCAAAGGSRDRFGSVCQGGRYKGCNKGNQDKEEGHEEIDAISCLIRNQDEEEIA